MYYYRARYYSPDLGRFLQTDPIGYYDSANLYQYCGNNPVNLTDALGLSSDQEIPPAPPGVSLGDNINIMHRMKMLHRYGTLGVPLARQLSWMPSMGYFAVLVLGPWNYKKRKSKCKNVSYEDFGNFHAGVVGNASGIPRIALLRGAGMAQLMQGNTRGITTKPWGWDAPYGDDYRDYDMNVAGMDYYSGISGQIGDGVSLNPGDYFDLIW